MKGESIPIRLFLAGYDLTPTMRDVQKKFSVKYYLNLVLVDEEERRYFKQQEIILWRKADKYKSKEDRSNQMQVYESAQEQQLRYQQEQERNNLTANMRNSDGVKPKTPAGGGAKKAASRVRHDENGDLLNDGDDLEEEVENDSNERTATTPQRSMGAKKTSSDKLVKNNFSDDENED